MAEIVIPLATARPVSLFNRLTPQAVFVLIAGFFGIAMALITPPIQVPDELAHWLRVYQLSQGKMVSTNYGGVVVNSIVAYSSPIWSDLQGHPLMKASVHEILQQFKVPLERQKTFFGHFPNSSLYSIVPYAPQTLAMFIARKSDWPPIALLYAGRIGTVLGYLLVGWAAIRITPILKWPTCMVLTHPMALFMAGSMSADPMTTAITFLATAIALWCIFSEKPIGNGTIVALAAAMIAVALCKSAYVPVVLLLFAIPSDKWGPGYRRWIIPLAIVLLTMITVVAWSALTKAGHVREAGDLPVNQLQWVLHHLTEYAKIMWHTLLIRSSFWVSSAGTLGWLDTPLASNVFDLTFFSLVCVLLAYDEPQRLRLWPRVLAAFAAVASIGLIMTANYLVWNPLGAPIIEGVQGRYFLPCALLPCIVLRRSGSYPVRPKWMLLLLCGTSLYTVWLLIERYYLPAGFLWKAISGT